MPTTDRFPPERLKDLREGRGSLLHRLFPGLVDKLPWRPLGIYPTPIEEIPAVSPNVRLFVKRDDLASAAYGGNKVRKLEHLLAAAAALDRKTLITMGGTGSNHAMATTIHGRTLGFDVELALYDQPITPHVERSLQIFPAAGATVHFGGGLPGAFRLARKRFVALRDAGERPFFIMVGGTSRLGCVGHVTAGLELAAQVARGDLPEPDVLFVPLGTCGTAAGLVAGLALAGLGTQVAAVRVAERFAANGIVVRMLAQDVIDYLHRLDPSVPRIRIGFDRFDVVPGYLGSGYGVATAAADAAVAWAAPRLSLETTYSGKALAAALDMARWSGTPQTFLFWNTYNSAPLLQTPENSSLSTKDL